MNANFLLYLIITLVLFYLYLNTINKRMYKKYSWFLLGILLNSANKIIPMINLYDIKKYIFLHYFFLVYLLTHILYLCSIFSNYSWHSHSYITLSVDKCINKTPIWKNTGAFIDLWKQTIRKFSVNKLAHKKFIYTYRESRERQEFMTSPQNAFNESYRAIREVYYTDFSK